MTPKKIGLDFSNAFISELGNNFRIKLAKARYFNRLLRYLKASGTIHRKHQKARDLKIFAGGRKARPKLLSELRSLRHMAEAEQRLEELSYDKRPHVITIIKPRRLKASGTFDRRSKNHVILSFGREKKAGHKDLSSLRSSRHMYRASQVSPLGKRAHIENMYELRQIDYDCGYRTTGEIVHCPGIHEGNRTSRHHLIAKPRAASHEICHHSFSKRSCALSLPFC